MAANTRLFRMPRAASCCSTIRSRGPAHSLSFVLTGVGLDGTGVALGGTGAADCVQPPAIAANVHKTLASDCTLEGALTIFDLRLSLTSSNVGSAPNHHSNHVRHRLLHSWIGGRIGRAT